MITIANQAKTNGHRAKRNKGGQKIEKVQKVMVTDWQFASPTLDSHNFQCT